MYYVNLGNQGMCGAGSPAGSCRPSGHSNGLQDRGPLGELTWARYWVDMFVEKVGGSGYAFTFGTSLGLQGEAEANTDFRARPVRSGDVLSPVRPSTPAWCSRRPASV